MEIYDTNNNKTTDFYSGFMSYMNSVRLIKPLTEKEKNELEEKILSYRLKIGEIITPISYHKFPFEDLKLKINDLNGSNFKIESKKILGNKKVLKLWEHYKEVIKYSKEYANANLSLVPKIAGNYKVLARALGFSFLDIVQEGNVGLLKAAEYFDYRVNKFSNYAGEFVKGYILRSFSNKGSAIRKPVRTIEDYLKINEEKIKFLLMYGRKPSDKELSKLTRLPEARVMKVKEICERKIKSLDELSGFGDNNEISLIDSIEDNYAPSPIECVIENEMKWKTRRLLRELSPREQKILRMNFGIDYSFECSLAEIGRDLGVSRERIRKIAMKASEKLKRKIKKQEYKELKMFLFS